MAQLKTRVFYPRVAVTAAPGAANWQSPESVFVNDGRNSTTAALTTGSSSETLKVTDFGITAADIPVDATILSVNLTIHGSTSHATCNDEVIKLIVDGALVGDNQALTTEAWALVETAMARGAGRWGYALTPAMMHETGFGFAIQAKATTIEPWILASIDYIELEIWYEVAGETVVATEYATSDDLADYLNTTAPTDAERMLTRASELINTVTRGQIDITNSIHTDAAKLAVCAQVEYWIEVGEDNDISGPVQSKQTKSVQLLYGAGDNRTSPLYLAARTYRILQLAGLLSRGVTLS